MVLEWAAVGWASTTCCSGGCENEVGDGHWAKDWYGARDRHEAKDQLNWVPHCLLPSLGCDVLPLVASPFAVGVASAMA